MSGKQNQKGRKKPLNDTVYERENGLDGQFKLVRKIIPRSPTPPAKKTPAEDPHKRFLKEEGLAIYAYARKQGYSIFGATLFLALAAQESGYGNTKVLDKFSKLNNFFGINAGKRKFKTKEEAIEYELEKDTGLMHRKYPLLDSLLKTNNPSLSQLDKGFKGYNLDPNGKNYATWLNKNVMHGVSKRAISAVDDEMADLQNRMDEVGKRIPPDVYELQKAAPFLLNDEDKLGLKIMDDLKSQMDNLRHIKQELETGKTDTDYFMWNPKPNFLNKKSAPADTTENTPFWQWGKPSGTNQNTNPWQGMAPAPSSPFGYAGGMQSLQPEDFSSPLEDSYPAYSSLLNGTGGNMPNIPAAGNISPPATAEQNRGGGGTSIHFQTMASLNNTHNHTANDTANIHAQVVAVLTSAVADYKIGTDIH